MKIVLEKQNFQTRVFLTLVSVVLLLLFFDLFLNYHRWIPYRPMRKVFNIAREDGLGTIYMVFVTMLNSFILYLIFYIKKTEEKYRSAGWLILSIFFLYLAIDDATQLHERVGSSFKILFKESDGIFTKKNILTYFPSYPWQLVFMPFFFCMGIFILIFFKYNFRNLKLFRFVVLGLTCFTLAVTLDFIEGFESPPYQSLADILGINVKDVSHYSKACEEALEMLGAIFLNTAFLRYLLSINSKWEILIKK